MITFTLAMHGPFHVSTGTPDEGMDSPIDLACPLPSTSLKGLLRAEATERLEIPQPVIDEIFGRSAWSASDDSQRSAPVRGVDGRGFRGRHADHLRPHPRR